MYPTVSNVSRIATASSKFTPITRASYAENLYAIYCRNKRIDANIRGWNKKSGICLTAYVHARKAAGFTFQIVPGPGHLNYTEFKCNRFFRWRFCSFWICFFWFVVPFFFVLSSFFASPFFLFVLPASLLLCFCVFCFPLLFCLLVFLFLCLVICLFLSFSLFSLTLQTSLTKHHLNKHKIISKSTRQTPTKKKNYMNSKPILGIFQTNLTYFKLHMEKPYPKPKYFQPTLHKSYPSAKQI